MFPNPKAEPSQTPIASAGHHAAAQAAAAPSAPPLDAKPKLSPPPGQPMPSPPAPTTSPAVLNVLSKSSQLENTIYNLIFAAGNKGKLAQDLARATDQHAAAIAKGLKNLVNRGVLKEVPSAQQHAKKLFMAVEFEPSAEITGCIWNHNGALDSDAVAAARRCCLAQIDALGAATVEMIYNGIKKANSEAQYTLAQVKEIVETVALDRVVEKVRSSGEGEFSAVKDGKVCYRRGGAEVGGMMEGIPSGVYPRIAECLPDGVISPRTCEHYKKWLQMDF